MREKLIVRREKQQLAKKIQTILEIQTTGVMKGLTDVNGALFSISNALNSIERISPKAWNIRPVKDYAYVVAAVAKAIPDVYFGYLKLSDTIRGYSNKIKLTTDDINKLQMSHTKLGNEQKSTAKTVENLKTGFKNVDDAVRKTIDGVDGLTGSFSGFSHGVDAARAKLDYTENLLKKYNREITTISKNLVTIGKAWTIKAVVETAGLVGIAKMGIDLNELKNRVKVTFGYMTEEVDKWASNLSKKLGLNKYELEDNAAILYNMAIGMGVTSKAALELSKNAAYLARDFASFYNLSSEEAFSKIQSGLSGEVKPLKDLGISVDEVSVKTEAYRMGLAKMGQELTNEEKVLARYSVMVHGAGVAVGDLDRTQNSLANRIRLFKETIREAMQTLGAGMIPVLQPLAEVLKQVGIWIKDVAEKFANLPLPMKKFLTVVIGINLAIGPLLWLLGKFFPIIVSIAVSMAIAATATGKFANVIKLIFSPWDRLMAGFSILTKIAPKVAAALAPFKGFIGDILGPVASFLGGLALKALSWIGWILLIIDAIKFLIHHWDLVKKAVKQFIDYVSGVFKPLVDDIKKGIQDIKNTLTKDLQPVIDSATKWWIQYGDEVKWIWNSYVAYIKVELALLWASLEFTFASIKLLFTTTWNAIVLIIRIAWNYIVGIVKAAIDMTTGMFSIFLDLLRGDWKQAWEDIKSLGSKLWKDILGIFSGFLDSIKDWWKSTIQSVKTWWNDLIDFFKINPIQATINLFTNKPPSYNMSGGMGDLKTAEQIQDVKDAAAVGKLPKNQFKTAMDARDAALVAEGMNVVVTSYIRPYGRNKNSQHPLGTALDIGGVQYADLIKYLNDKIGLTTIKETSKKTGGPDYTNPNTHTQTPSDTLSEMLAGTWTIPSVDQFKSWIEEYKADASFSTDRSGRKTPEAKLIAAYLGWNPNGTKIQPISSWITNSRSGISASFKKQTGLDDMVKNVLAGQSMWSQVGRVQRDNSDFLTEQGDIAANKLTEESQSKKDSVQNFIDNAFKAGWSLTKITTTVDKLNDGSESLIEAYSELNKTVKENIKQTQLVTGLWSGLTSTDTKTGQFFKSLNSNLTAQGVDPDDFMKKIFSGNIKGLVDLHAGGGGLFGSDRAGQFGKLAGQLISGASPTQLGSTIGGIGGSFLGPAGEAVGSTLGGIIGGLFEKKKRVQITEPIPVKVTNFQDLYTQLLNITKVNLNTRAAAGVDTVGNLRLQEQMTLA